MRFSSSNLLEAGNLSIENAWGLRKAMPSCHAVAAAWHAQVARREFRGNGKYQRLSARNQ